MKIKSFLVILFLFLFSAPQFLRAQNESEAAATKMQLDKQVSQAILYYSYARQLPKEEVASDVSNFLRNFFSYVERESSFIAETTRTPEAIAASEKEFGSILEQYDSLVRNDDAQIRLQEFNALAVAIKDLTSSAEKLEKYRRLLEKLHDIINIHYTKLVIAEAKKSRAPFRIQVTELTKTVGSYCIYALSLSTMAHYLTGEYKTLPLFSEPFFIRTAIVATASAPFAFFNQLYLQTFDYIGWTIRDLKEKADQKRASSKNKCSVKLK